MNRCGRTDTTRWASRLAGFRGAGALASAAARSFAGLASLLLGIASSVAEPFTLELAPTNRPSATVPSEAWAVTMLDDTGTTWLTNGATLDFGGVLLGRTAQWRLGVVAGPTGAVEIASMVVGDQVASVAVTNTPFRLGAREARDSVLTFAPGAAGVHRAALEIRGRTDRERLVRIELVGRAFAVVDAQPRLVVEPLSLAFGDVRYPENAERLLRLRNDGNAPLNVSAVSVTGDAFAAIGVDGRFTIAPGAELSLTVRFTPTRAGPESGTLNVRSDDPANPVVSVGLSGTGRRAIVEARPAALDFGGVAVGASKELDFVLVNTGNQAARVTRMMIQNGSFKGVLPAGPFDLPVNGREPGRLRFAPPIKGLLEGVVSVFIDNQAVASLELPVRGTGLVPEIAIDPATLDFGEVEVGDSRTRTGRIRNVGQAELVVSSATVSGTAFRLVAPAFPARVAPGGSVAVEFVFRPCVASSESESVTLASNDPARPKSTIALRGNGVLPDQATVALRGQATASYTITFGDGTARHTLDTDIDVDLLFHPEPPVLRGAEFQSDRAAFEGRINIHVLAVATAPGERDEQNLSQEASYQFGAGHPVQVNYSGVSGAVTRLGVDLANRLSFLPDDWGVYRVVYQAVDNTARVWIRLPRPFRYAEADEFYEVPVRACWSGPTGGVVGQVWGCDTGGPVVGAVVTVLGARATTDATGRFALDGLPAGAAQIRIEKEGFDLWEGARVVPPFRDLEERFELQKPGSLLGSVVAGQPPKAVPGAEVRLGSFTGRTDAAGQFTVPSISGGVHEIEVTKAGYDVFRASVTIPGCRRSEQTFNLSAAFELVALEVTQSIQDLENSVLLVEDKATYVRAYIQPRDPAASKKKIPAAQLKANWDAPQRTATQPPSNPDLEVAPKVLERRADWTQTLNFRLPDDWLRGEAKLEVEMDGLDCSKVSCPVRAPFVPVAVPRVKILGVRWEDSTGTAHEPPSLDERRQLAIQLRAVYPTARVWFEPGILDYTGLLAFRPDVSAPPGAAYLAERDRFLQELLGSLQLRRFLEGGYDNPAQEATLWFASFKGGWPTDVGGRSLLSEGVACGFLSLNPADSGYLVHAHELGHLLGRQHSVPAGAPPAAHCEPDEVVGSCGECAPAAALKDPFPFYEQINGMPLPTLSGLSGGDAKVAFGLDVSGSDGGPDGAPRLVSPREHFELMSYAGRNTGNCQFSASRWISTHTYSRLAEAINQRVSRPAAPALASRGLAAYWIVRGHIDLAIPRCEIEPVYRLAVTGEVPRAEPGDFELRLLGVGGALLGSTSFGLPESADDAGGAGPGTGSFLVAVPEVQGCETIAVAWKGTVLGSRRRSRSAPELTLVCPKGGERIEGDSLRICWTGRDADGERLSYTVQLSSDNGVTWETLVIDWPDPEYVADTAQLKGSTQCRVRVLASDGLNTTIAVSESPFALADRPPRLRIVSPVPGQRFAAGSQVALEVDAWDAEDGSIPPDQVVWRWRDGSVLGRGHLLLLNSDSLAAGAQVLTVTATDSGGGETTREVALVIQSGDRPELVVETLGGGVVLSWPAAAEGFVLQVSESVGEGALWTPVPGPVTSAAGRNRVPVEVSSGQRFYRLARATP